ncbi:hypothetical protein BLOT_004196 [Blomia tropicalis]|nr:hypothetical protein BLOT_004196 [Blomia tropicalis]
MRAITADFKERIVIAPEDVIPKSSWFKFVKCSLLTTLTLLIVFAIIMMLVAESLVKNHDKDSLTIGIISLIGIIIFLLGIISIMKEHIPLILTFSVSMIIYLLVFMYSRVITSPGLIILRTFIILLLAIGAFYFCIVIRDWREIQISRLNQRLIRDAQLMEYNKNVMGNYHLNGYHQPMNNNRPIGNDRSPTAAIMSPMYTDPNNVAVHYAPHNVNQQYELQSHLMNHPSNRQSVYLHGGQSRVQQHQHQPMRHPNRMGQPVRGTSMSPIQSTRYQMNVNQTPNPYIMVDDEDENPYAQIVEPPIRTRSIRQHQQTNIRVYAPNDSNRY